MYNVPEEYYFRIHHVRPRFKNDVENVLFYMAKQLIHIGKLKKDDHIIAMNNAIYKYPGNATRTLKTINNWRTEISALFGLFESDRIYSYPSRRALELAEHQDLVEFFKRFLFTFQYPGAHIKSQETLKQAVAGIAFKPAQYILRLLRTANNGIGSVVGITKAEACHCIFNDLRATRNEEGVDATWNRILNNRRNNTNYDETGDVIRYAGDIIDYMELANLLKSYDHRTYYLNKLESEAIIKFCESEEWFSGYDSIIRNKRGSVETVKSCIAGWFAYVNRDMGDTDFATDILAYLADNEEELQLLRRQSTNPLFDDIDQLNRAFHSRNVSGEQLSTKDIGDIGEGLIYGHECMRIKLAGCDDLIHLIKRIPSAFAVGYDIKSVEVDMRQRLIEVKTTISNKPIQFNQIHLTPNEWNAASTFKDRYYIYRLSLSKSEKQLYLLQDPVTLFKQDMINIVPSSGGIDITFDPKVVGSFEELLKWVS